MTTAPPRSVAHAVLALDVGGLERVVVALAGVARRRGQTVTVICVERPGPLAAAAAAAGVGIECLGKPPGRRAEYIDAAGKLLASLRPDVVHTHQIGAAWYVGRAAGRLGLPVLHTEHGNPFARAAGRLEAIKHRLFYRQAARSIDGFCCVSDEIAAAVTRWRTVPRRAVRVVPNGIEVGEPNGLPSPAEVRASVGIPPEARVVGTVGRLVEVKRQDVLLRAFAGLPDPTTHLLLVGDGPEVGPLKQLAADLGIADRVHFAGYQPRPEAFLRAMDVFALTSRSEGFPVSLLEAWAAGRPVVCSAVGGIPKVVTDGQTGLLFPAGDVPALTAKLSAVFTDAALSGRLAAAGRAAVVGRYSLDRVADEYEEHYRRLPVKGSG